MKKIHKKAQAVLPFFGLQLASIIIFLIVVISLLTLKRDLIIAANEFNSQTESILQTRRLLSSADCFASEEKDIYFYNQSGTSYILSGSRIYPYVLDKAKLNDLIHFNCMRKDFYDSPADASMGVIDLKQGTGASSKYEIAVYDLQQKIFIYGSTSGTSLKAENRQGSKVGHIEKEGHGCSFGFQCRNKYGSGYDCVNQTDVWVWPLKYIFKWGGTCVGADSVSRFLYYNYRPVEYNLTTNDPQTVFELHNGVLTSHIISINCSDKPAIRSIFPVMLKVGDEQHPAIIFIRTCTIKGSDYKGIPFCERSFQLGGTEGCE